MKKIFYFAFMLVLVTMSSSCEDFLETDNKSNVTDQAYFSTRSGLQTLLNNAYESLHDIYASTSYTTFFQAGTDMYGDARNYINDELHEYETLNPENSVMKTLYTTCYQGIRKALAVNHYAETANITDAERNAMTSQARFIAANYYYILVNTFGGVPIMTEYIESAEVGYPRNSTAEVYDHIISELESVIADNALQASTATNGGGEASMEATRALLAKTYLAAAWDLNKTDYFNKAAQYADQVIGSRKLTTPFADLWKGDGSGDDNEEFIWDLEYDYASANNTVNGGHSWHSFYTNHIGGQEDHGKTSTSAFVATLHAVEYFEKGDVRYDVTFMTEIPDINQSSPYSYWDWHKNNGSLIGTPIKRYYPAWYATAEDIEAWRALDPENRKDTWILPMSNQTHNSQEYSDDIVDYETFVTFSFGSAPVKKFDDSNVAQYGTGTDYRDLHIITLSDVYLYAAEAYLKAGNESKALERINEVHQRAGLSALTSVDIDVILKERACELFGQGSRWIDLRRTQKLVEYNDLYNPQIRGRAALCIGQKLLRPIPQGAIDANESLSNADQNPGY